jgi:class III poly(R)-hydroxyalkanoic acid synthase PhaE subunit
MGESPNPEWLDQWQALSRQYLGAWQQATQAGAGPAAMASADGLEPWSRLFAGATGGQGETIARLVDSAKSYTAFMQSVLAATNAAAQGQAPSWADALRNGFAAGGGNGAFDASATRAWPGPWMPDGAGFAQCLAAARTPPPAEFPELKSWLALPAFGYLREHQEHYQKSAVAWVEYQEQMARYNALMQQASRRGFALFEGKLAEREQPGRQIESLRALYDLWVDAAEEGYAEIALSPEFREVYGALVNAQMRVRAQIHAEVERIGTDLGMPTRSEIDSIGERLQATRREVRTQRGELDGKLAGEIAALRAELAALRRTVNAGATATAKTAATEHAAASPRKRTRGSHRAAATAQPAASAKRQRKNKSSTKAAAGTRRPAAAASFASRIEKFADASLGPSRAQAPRKRSASRASRKKH